MQLVAAIAAVLLALARHAVDERLLGAVVERVNRGLEQALQARFVAAENRRVGPGKDSPPDMDVTNKHGPRGAMDMQLKPARAFKIKRLEVVQAGPADEAGPGIEVRIEQRRTAGRVGLVDEQLDGGPCRRLDAEARPAHHLFGELESQRRASLLVQDDPPLAVGSLGGYLRPLGLERSRSPKLEVLLRRDAPAHAIGLGELGRRDYGFTQHRDAPWTQFGVWRSVSGVQEVLIVAG